MLLTRPRIALLLLALWSAAVAVLLALLAPHMAPVRRGTAAGFWEVACGIELAPPDHPRSGEIFVDDAGWFIYELDHLHGSDPFYVPADEAISLMDDAIRKVQSIHSAGRTTPAVVAWLAWRDTPEGRARDAAAFVKQIREAKRQKFLDERPDLLPYLERNRESLETRWLRWRTYWATLAFEWLLFIALAAIALRPWRLALSPLGWAAHHTLLPLLFMLPLYLGYSTLTFTSAGPSGGVLYPWLHAYVTIPFFNVSSMRPLDRSILEHLPQVLEPISTPIGTPSALSGAGMPGPTDALLIGLLFGIVAGAARWTWLERTPPHNHST